MIDESDYDGYANIGVIGVGSGMNSVLDNLKSKITKHVKYIYLYVDDDRSSQADNVMPWENYEKDTVGLKELLKKFDAVFLITHLCDENGADILSEVANLNEDSRFMKIGVVIRPENQDESRPVSSGCIRRFQESTNMLLTLPHNDMIIYGCVGALMALLCGETESGRALLNDDLWDMVPLIREAGRTYAGFGECSGENAIEQAYINAVSNLPSKNCITDAKGLIVAAFADEGISVTEVYGYAESILEYCPDSKFMFNAFSERGIKDKAYVAVFTTGIDSIEKNDDGEKLILKPVKRELLPGDCGIEVPDFLKTPIKKCYP
jgi:cell division GTPase FtsZ